MAKKKDEKTNVMRILDQKKIPYTPHFYEEQEGPEGTRDYGVHVAQALGQDPKRAFKTLVAKGASGTFHVFDMELLPVKDITAVTGYIRGGCSPVGMKKAYPTLFHKTALDFETIYISAGKIGAQVEAEPGALLALLRAETADLII